MEDKLFTAKKITVEPVKISFYVPPVIWKGNPMGHIGEYDAFFWLLEGEIALFIDNDCYIMHAGQLAFLPKGKTRRYTTASKNFSLYTLSFVAESDGKNLMQGLNIPKGSYVVNASEPEEITKLFEKSSLVSMNADPINNVICNANILNIIKEFYIQSKKKVEVFDIRFSPVIQYMKDNLNQNITIESLASIVHMQPTYFIRRFRQIYDLSPMAYLKALRINKAVELLLTTNTDVDEIGAMLGIYDVSYFSRWFKKSCGLPPGEYRKKSFDSISE